MKLFSIKLFVDFPFIIPDLMKHFFDDMLECDTVLAVMADPTRKIITLSCIDNDFFNFLKDRVSDYEEDYGTVHFISDNIYGL